MRAASDSVRAELEGTISVPLPAWMTDWPPGLRPTRVFLEGPRLFLLYLHPRGGWVRVRLSLYAHRVEARVVSAGPAPHALGLAAGPSARRGARARAGGGQGTITAAAVARLLEAIEHRSAAHLGDVRRWLARARSALAEIAVGAAARGNSQACARVAHLDAPGCDEARRVLRARHDTSGALASFDPEPERGDGLGPAALACRAFLTSLAGLNLVAIAQAERAAELARGPEEREAIAELLLALGRPEPALACLERARLEGDVRPMRLAHAAGAAGDVSLAVAAVEALMSGERSEDALGEALDALLEAGGHEQARRLLQSHVDDHPSPHLFGRLAELRLGGLELREAEAAADRALALDAHEPRAHLVLGALASLDGRHREALARLERVEDAGLTATARLWCVRSWIALGRLREAVEGARSMGFADRVAWKLWRAYAEVSAGDEGVARGKDAYQIWIVLEHVLGDTLREVDRSPETLSRLLIEAIARLGGNYGEPTTYLEANGRVRLANTLSPRNMAIAAQHLLLTRPLSEALAELDEQARRMPDSPFPKTYRSELVLWSGDYEAARASFEEVWRESRTRWGYVGLGAAEAALGRPDDALRTWAEGLEHYTYLPGEATFTYRGEVHLAAGRFSEALVDLEQATRENPQRLGAWNALALARTLVGDVTRARRAFEEVEALAPGLVAFATDSTGIDGQRDDPEGLRALTERIRSALAGNRASTIYTFRDDAGRLRVLRSAPPGHHRELARRLGALATSVLAAALLPD